MFFGKYFCDTIETGMGHLRSLVFNIQEPLDLELTSRLPRPECILSLPLFHSHLRFRAAINFAALSIVAIV
jgi:hypothetical protein